MVTTAEAITPSGRRRKGIRVAGVDGCRGGWFVVLLTYEPAKDRIGEVDFALCARFAEVLDLPARHIALDMPVGLLEHPQAGGRRCERQARAVLGRPRASSVFSTPTRGALAATDYRDAIRRNGMGMSKETFNIMPKIREVDVCLSGRGRQRVFEAHPELAFARLAGAGLAANKKTESGRRQRLRLLRDWYGAELIAPAKVRAAFPAAALAQDDIVDAYALAITAVRIAAKNATRLPRERRVERDARGLRMEIWY